MELKLGYKRTEVGIIPEDWKVLSIREFVSLQRGHDLTWRDRKAGDVVVMGSAGPNGYHNVALAKGPGVVIGRSGASFGEAHYCESDFWPHNTALYVVDFLCNDPLFAFFLLKATDFSRHNSGGAQQSLNRNFIGSIKLGVPPPDQQRIIAAALNDVDVLLSGLDRLIAKKRDLKQAAMQQLLTGQTRLPGFSGEWKLKRLGHVGKCLRGVSYRGDMDLSAHDTSSTIRLLRSNNVQNAVVVLSDIQFVHDSCVSAEQVLQKGDILVCMANGSKALVGKAGIFSIQDGYVYTFGAFMGCFRTNADLANPAFVFSLLQTRNYREYISNILAGSSISNLRPSSIESLEFCFPDLAEQAAIAQVLSDMDAEISALDARRAKARELKQAMMQELLTGRIRLVSGVRNEQ